VCLSPRASRFLSVFYQRHGEADVDGVIWNNDLLIQALACRRQRWHQQEVSGAQAVGAASI
jgi:hypothetical protein